MTLYDVEGVWFPRPFRIRRFGHFGVNLESIDGGIDFYGRLLGLEMTDLVEIRKLSPPGAVPASVLDDRVPCLSCSTDHHSMVMHHPSAGPLIGGGSADSEFSHSHFSWQVGSLNEVVEAQKYLFDSGVKINRCGRDLPGSNWHCYFAAPDGQIFELYYGMEQVGINGRSKPYSYYDRRFDGDIPVPQMSDFDERAAATARGDSMEDGFQRTEFGGDARYDVAGVLLRRPFKVTQHGPVGIFVDNVQESLEFYKDVLGFSLTELVRFKGHDFAFLRLANEHHSLKLYPLAARDLLGLNPGSRTVSIGFRVGSYRQLKNAVSWLKEEGVRFIEQPPELNPGIDYCAYALDHEGHCVQLFCGMEAVDWNGNRRPHEMRRSVETTWPESLTAFENTYADQAFMGPLG